MSQKIVYIPLDERPCNYIYPDYIARIGGCDIIKPNKSMLGSFKKTADTGKLWDWLFDNAKTASHLVLSVDMLLYGGIVPSRLHQLTAEECLRRVAKFVELRNSFPAMQIYAFQLITRAPARNGSGEEPDYYEEHGYDIFRYGVIADKKHNALASPEDVQEEKEILCRVPSKYLDDFLNRRKINFENCIEVMKLAAKNTVNHFVVPLDDCFSYGYAPSERKKLSQKAAELGILSKISMYPGADEMGCTLISRALCNIHNLSPAVFAEYSSEAGRLTTPQYEDRSICETAPHHILCAGGKMASTIAEADIALMINPPTAFSNTIKFNLDRRKIHMEPERNLNHFIGRIQHHIHSERICIVSDSAIPDGADQCLMLFLQEQSLLRKIDGFSAWNTSSNAMGTAIAQGIALYCLQNSPANQQKSLDLSKEFCFLRYIEDWGYMTHVRQTISEDILAGKYGAEIDVRYLGAYTSSIEQDITLALRTFAQENLPNFAYEISATLPWKRMFEIELTLTAI